jgi:hypothetical protein
VTVATLVFDARLRYAAVAKSDCAVGSGSGDINRLPMIGGK